MYELWIPQLQEMMTSCLKLTLASCGVFKQHISMHINI